jgi:hypothetical protein
MKKIYIIPLCLFAFLAVSIFLLLRNNESSMPALSPLSPVANVPVAKNIAQSSVRAQQLNRNDNTTSAPTVQAIPTLGLVTPEEKDAKMRAVIEAKNVPLEFYGKVIDQDSNALPGVNIKVWVRHWNVKSWAGVRLATTTDNNGRFMIGGATGDAFDIESFGKVGYELEPGQRGFGAVGGSLETPVVFKMWSTNIHEQLITGEKSFHIQPDGRPYFINLTEDTISESGGGDLKVWIQYTNQVVRGQVYDWSCEIDAMNGGLLEEDNLNSAMYVAPTGNYTPTFQLKQQIKGSQYGSIGDKRFYIFLKNGREYGRMQIDLIAPYNDQIPGMVRLSYAINPSGSRILKP